MTVIQNGRRVLKTRKGLGTGTIRQESKAKNFETREDLNETREIVRL